MPKKPESRVPSAVAGLPVVGDLVRSADVQARWMQELLEQNARMMGQLPATMKTFNDALERFNQTVSRLDRAVTTLENTTRSTQRQLATLQATVERIVTVLGELPGVGLVRRITGTRDERPRPGGAGSPD